MMRKPAMLAVVALTACSGGGTSPSPNVARAPIAQSSAPASTSSLSQATLVIHWPSIAQTASSAKRRETISPSAQSISVSVNGGVATVVNKPALSGSPTTTSVSIPAPSGNDAFTFTAWDQLAGTGAILDQATATQTIVANANNAVSVALDGICAALVPTLSGSPTFITYQNTTAPLVSGSRTILQSARLIGPSAKTIAYTRVDADGNTILTSAGVSPIAVAEAGTTPHVTIAPVATAAANTSFTLTPIAAQPDGTSTTITATSPDCGTGTPTFPNSFQLSTSAEIVVADAFNGLLAYDQDGLFLGQLSTTTALSGVAYNAKSGYLVAVKSNSGNGIAFQTLSTTGTAIGSGTFTPAKVGKDTNASTQSPGQIVYNPINGNFYLTLQSQSTTIGGAIEEYSISGSSATYVAATDISAFTSDVDPVSIAVDYYGDVLVNDESTTNTKSGDAETYSLPDTLAGFNASAGIETTSLAYDTTRQNIITFAASSSTTQAAGTASNDQFFEPDSFVTPESLGLNIQVAAYSPGNDECYFFDNYMNEISHAYGLSGTTLYTGGSKTSNLPGDAFGGVYDPSAAVALP